MDDPSDATTPTAPSVLPRAEALPRTTSQERFGTVTPTPVTLVYTFTVGEQTLEAVVGFADAVAVARIRTRVVPRESPDIRPVTTAVARKPAAAVEPVRSSAIVRHTPGGYLTVPGRAPLNVGTQPGSLAVAHS
ncbi:hypothetical protein [Nocardioides vastitatis]|uniref:Uncharacterized protein n=1 Tax=Nocardioides vastitatis TaxID=2568655 RepID=A0ABW0ZBK7_9ACTN|nr:hypothetical protein E7Z54_18730 [Nocardioides sp.]